MWLDIVELAESFDEGGDDRPIFSSCIMAGEGGNFCVEHDRANNTFHSIVIHLDTAIIKKQTEIVPVFVDVFEGFSQGRGGYFGAMHAQPS